MALLGCAQATVFPEPAEPELPTRDTPISTTAIRSGTSWTITSDTNPHSYASVSQIVLELMSGSETPRDSMTIRSQYSLAFDRINESVPISGKVDLFVVQAGNKIGPILQAETPVFFSGKATKGQVSIGPVSETPNTSVSMTCPNSWSSTISAVRRSIFLLPRQILRGMTWRDSTSSVDCHGPTPISLITSYNYRVIGEINYQKAPALLIERTGKTSLNGQGSEGQHRVTVVGEGNASGSFHIDRETGVLLEASDEQKTKLIITSSGRSQEFSQIIRERITRTDR